MLQPIPHTVMEQFDPHFCGSGMFQETDKFIKALRLCKNDLCLNCNNKQVHICRFVNMSIENNLGNALIYYFFFCPLMWTKAVWLKATNDFGSAQTKGQRSSCFITNSQV